MAPAPPEYMPLPLDPFLQKDFHRIGGLEGMMAAPIPTAKDMPPNLLHEGHTFPGPDNTEIMVSVFRQKEHDATPSRRLGPYHIHGGGMVTGNCFSHTAWALKVAEKLDAICVSVEHRLAPMHPDPAPVEDCHAGLV